MKRRALFHALAAGFVVLGFGALDARAGFIPLPTTMDQLLPAGNFTTVQNNFPGGEFLTFTNFSYSVTAVSPAVTYPASGVNVNPFTTAGPPAETGLEFTAGWIAPSGGILDIAINFTVTAEPGHLLTDAFLLIAGSTGGDGIASVGETLSNGVTLTASLPSPPGSISDYKTFAGVSSLTIHKDIILFGGTTPGSFASVSIVAQGFSSEAVPEPASMALLGIGMTGFLAFRRFFKKTSVA